MISFDDRAERLRRADLIVTQPRLLVLECLEDMGGHQSVQDIMNRLSEAGRTLPRATVYNVVRDLVQAGIAMQTDLEEGRARYEVAEVWHHHFVCSSCSRIIDVPCVIGDKPCLDARVPGAEIAEAQVVFRGLCEDCQSV